jgi:hypothetical protein
VSELERLQKSRDATVDVRSQRDETKSHDRITAHGRYQKQDVHSIRKIGEQEKADDKCALDECSREESDFEVSFTAVDTRQSGDPNGIQILCHHDSPFTSARNETFQLPSR